MPLIRLHLREADGDLPNACMCCGEEATVTKTKNMQWTPPWVGILILVGLLPYIIVALVTTKRARLQAPFCDDHKGHWFNRTLINVGSFFGLAFIGVAVFAGLFILPPKQREDLFGFACLGCVFLFIAWIVIMVVCQSTAIRCKEITDREIVLDGVSQAFVDIMDDEDRERERRRRTRRRDYDDDDDDRPRKKRPSDDDDDDDRPRRKRPPSDAFEE